VQIVVLGQAANATFSTSFAHDPFVMPAFPAIPLPARSNYVNKADIFLAAANT
jgi:hypothetical protein